MLRLVFRLFLLVYFVLPLLAGFLVVQTLLQFRDDVTPVFDAASSAIASASATLEREVRNLRSSFAPLEVAIRVIRDALQALLTFIRDTIYTLIDVVNTINPACSAFRTACIGKAIHITLPQLVDLAFLTTISTQITTISTQINTVVTTTTSAIHTYATLLTLAGVGFGVWGLLTLILFYVTLLRGLWR